MNDEKLSIGLLGAGGKLIIKDGFLNFSHPYGKTFKVLIADIDTVVVDAVGMGKGELKIIGKGTELAKVKMPIPWANKCQEWILTRK
ncbi:MAG: hypothetical protein PHT51_04875 [Patescibacteria group bacterium]|nr:hypothetical protein [Patescibacteria group bacterium]MDD4610616.1 hypothetical protein [Patescibacteria group bacterium]